QRRGPACRRTSPSGGRSGTQSLVRLFSFHFVGRAAAPKEGAMNSKPFIGINADFRSAQGDKPAFSYLASGYYDAISEIGGLPLLIPPLEEDDDLNAVLDRLDGVLLVGGADLDPRRDGFMTHPSVRPLAERRENFDRRLARLIAKRRFPVMGIGVGMQLL